MVLGLTAATLLSVAEEPARTQLLYTIISAVGGGTLVPLAWGAWKRHKPEEVRSRAAREDERATKAAREAVDAVRDVLGEMRKAREEDQRLLALQEGELVQLRRSEAMLKQQVADLTTQIALLEKRVTDLESTANGTGVD